MKSSISQSTGCITLSISTSRDIILDGASGEASARRGVSTGHRSSTGLVALTGLVTLTGLVALTGLFALTGRAALVECAALAERAALTGRVALAGLGGLAGLDRGDSVEFNGAELGIGSCITLGSRLKA